MENIISEFNARKLLYENREILSEFLHENSEEISEENKKINDVIVKGQKTLFDNMIKYNNSSLQKQNIEETIVSTKTSLLDFQNRIQNLKYTCSNNQIEIENLQDMIDQINYNLIFIVDEMESSLEEKLKNHEKEMVASKKIIQSLAKSYNILRNTSISYTCPICIVNQVDVYLDCGHTLCTRCAGKANHCFFCRACVSKIRKLYFTL